MRPICETDGCCNPCKMGSKKKDGTPSYKRLCCSCHGDKHTTAAAKDKQRAAKKLREKYRKRPYLVFRKKFCESCGFIAVHECQLDVDHIDGNNSNNDIGNLQTLCANCHRLKTYLNQDWKK